MQLPGMALAGLALLASASMHRVDGVPKVTSGHLGRWASRCPFVIVTLGQALGHDIPCMAALTGC